MNRIDGLCIVPEERVSDKKGYPFEVYDSEFLEDIIKFANRKNLGLVYLSLNKGLVYRDDLVEGASRLPSSLNRDELRIWSRIVYEDIIRKGLEFGTLNIYLMCTHRNNFSSVLSLAKRSGRKIKTPIMGRSKSEIKEILERG